MQHNTSQFCWKLRELQGGLCALCAKALSPNQMTVDHVWPRAVHRNRQRNHVAAHYACNHAKGGRLPTGCELIWLDAVNARRGEPLTPPSPQLPPLPSFADLWPA